MNKLFKILFYQPLLLNVMLFSQEKLNAENFKGWKNELRLKNINYLNDHSIILKYTSSFYLNTQFT